MNLANFLGEMPAKPVISVVPASEYGVVLATGVDVVLPPLSEVAPGVMYVIRRNGDNLVAVHPAGDDVINLSVLLGSDGSFCVVTPGDGLWRAIVVTPDSTAQRSEIRKGFY